jgi:hypothetical protein
MVLKPQRLIAFSLVFCLLAVGGAANGLLVQHELEHAHHKAATHATAVCTWVCSAGQVLEGLTVALPVTLAPLEILSVPRSDEWIDAVRVVAPSRGPPALSL